MCILVFKRFVYTLYSQTDYVWTLCLVLSPPPPSSFLSLSLSLLLYILSFQASLIYEGTDFNPAGSPIHFGIQRIVVEQNPPPSGDPFANEFLGVQSFLDLHSRGDFSDFCLSYRFTNRDFDNGVVGLAYIGQPLGSNAAGMRECPCEFQGFVRCTVVHSLCQDGSTEACTCVISYMIIA